MRSLARVFTRAILGVGLASSLLAAGCATHTRVYGYSGSYHRWDDHEVVYYGRWEHETHRNHMDFYGRSDADRKAYWEWRNKHQ